ncbi:MAG TPA: hypothetical protein VJY85_00285, partial [Candidatus Limnocylindria bacterium]|nr:hypothetical protein [Candidatus Limnocylindria bacterium]
DDLVLGLLILVGLVVFGFAFWFLLLPLLLVVLDIFVLLLLFLLATAARVLLGRPWTVEAVATSSPTRRRRTTRRSRSRSADGEPRTITTLVRGWRNALRTRDRLAEALLQGAPTDSPVSESA